LISHDLDGCVGHSQYCLYKQVCGVLLCYTWIGSEFVVRGVLIPYVHQEESMTANEALWARHTQSNEPAIVVKHRERS
jgi:hypothetical protein